MNRREFSKLACSLPGLSILSGCWVEPANQYEQFNLVSDETSASLFSPSVKSFAEPSEFINAWGIAIRPAGAGGHFWITAGKYSYQFVGDVKESADPNLRVLYQDQLRLIRIPGVTDDGGFSTGTVFNGANLESNQFVVKNQPVGLNGQTIELNGSARFLFATDTGVISGWTERDPSNPGKPVREDGPAIAMIDDSGNGAAFFGIALRPDNWSTLWVADFGKNPRLRQYNDQWEEVELQGFENPFASGPDGKLLPGDYAPFNVQTLAVNATPFVFVAYAKTQEDPEAKGQFFAAEEDALSASDEGNKPNRGKVVMYSLDGQQIQVFDDKRLNAPWGLAVAPQGFGELSGKLLVGNFGGAGRIAAYDISTGRFTDWMRDAKSQIIGIPGLWGLQFGNGESLGDVNALYFAAGPSDETQGLFGALRPLEPARTNPSPFQSLPPKSVSSQ
ncbi:MAG TPA: TIGR03118 family protein [Limnobacter sp.]|nr:TIGR03118 family protein [Limnobacter sp.]